MDVFFYCLPVYGFQKNFKIFVLLYCIDSGFYEKILQNYSFFSKKIEIFEIQNFNKIPLFTISFLFFWHFFSISPIQTCPKIMEFFVVLYWKAKRFYQQFLENSKSCFKKILICEICFFPKFCGLVFVFFFFTFEILFLLSICSCQKIVEIFMLFYFMN